MTLNLSFPLLEGINNPAQLRELSEEQLPLLAEELRDFLLHSVSRTGGHLASNLGVVELTIALHYVFNTPDDRLVWDVGHQSYPHKILTGRRAMMDSIRQNGGISGFPRRSESSYDTFGVGHSSTSISAALGMSLALRRAGLPYKVIAVIGDGAMTAGMAFEALNHAGGLYADALVILNDNKMSISPNVGALSHYFSRLLSSRLYAGIREGGKRVLRKMPEGLFELAQRAESHVKNLLVPGALFEEMGFNYIGPIDGHNLTDLTQTLRTVKDLKGPQLLHIVTCKGKGFTPAEENPCEYHGVGAFDRVTGKMRSTPSQLTYTQVFGEWLCEMAAQDSRLVAITPAMREGSGMVKFSQQFPERFFDVGIAEQHSVTLAAGLACEGLKPVVAIYSTFLQRAYDQLIHDVALQNLPVLFAIDRAGLVGGDGPTHAGSFDLSYLRCIPNLVLMAPADENECRQMLTTGFRHAGPAAVRYPRGVGAGAVIDLNLTSLPIGKAEVRRTGQIICFLVFGSLLPTVLEAAAELNATVANMRFIKPLDETLLVDMANQHELLVTVEENVIMGGAGSAVSEFLRAKMILTPLIHLGLPDQFLEHGDPKILLAACGLDKSGIAQAAQTALGKRRGF